MSIVGTALGAVSTYKWFAIGGVALAAVGFMGYQRVEIADLETTVAEWKAKFSKSEADRATDRKNAAEAALKTAAEYREKEQGWARKFDEDRNANETKIAAADAAVARANAVAGSLSKRVAALVAAARGPAAGASAPAACAAAADSADLLGRMLERVDSNARIVAAYADKLRISGEACVSAYQTVTQPAAAASAASSP